MTTLAKLSRRERQIMEIVYALNSATLSEILDRVENPPTRPALRSILGILENKGHLTHDKRGREFVYRATRSRTTEGRSALKRVLDTFFSGSIGEAVATHFSDPKANYSEEELAELVESIKRAQNRKPKRSS